jgi:putative flippase GtrA
VFVTWLQFNSTVIKLIAQIVVLVLNYVISKLLVFRKK